MTSAPRTRATYRSRFRLSKRFRRMIIAIASATSDYELAGWVSRMLRGEPAQFDLFVVLSAEVEVIANLVTGAAEAYCVEMLRLLEAVRPPLLGTRAL